MTGNGGGMGFRDSFGPKFGNYGMSYPVERLPFPVDAERLAVLGEVLTHLVTILTFIWNDVVKQFQTGSGLSERDDPGSKQYGMQWNDPLSVLALQLFIATVIDIQAPGTVGESDDVITVQAVSLFRSSGMQKSRCRRASSLRQVDILAQCFPVFSIDSHYLYGTLLS